MLQIIAAIQPAIVQPNSKLSTAIAPELLCLRDSDTIHGKKYMHARKMNRSAEPTALPFNSRFNGEVGQNIAPAACMSQRL